ncbi:MAG: Uncharacterized MFS-type transporter, partial [uncultured Arthrobacter sp.]
AQTPRRHHATEGKQGLPPALHRHDPFGHRHPAHPGGRQPPGLRADLLKPERGPAWTLRAGAAGGGRAVRRGDRRRPRPPDGCPVLRARPVADDHRHRRAGLGRPQQRLAAVPPGRGAERCGRRQPAHPQFDHSAARAARAPARGQCAEHDHLRPGVHGGTAARGRAGGAGRLRLDLHDRRRHLHRCALGSVQPPAHAARGADAAGRAVLGARGVPVPGHPPEHPHDLPRRPRRHDPVPAAGAAAGHRRRPDRRRGIHGGHSARGRGVRLGARGTVLRPARPDPPPGPGRAVVHRGLGCLGERLRPRGRRGRSHRARRRRRGHALDHPRRTLPRPRRHLGLRQFGVPQHHPAVRHPRCDARAAAGRLHRRRRRRPAPGRHGRRRRRRVAGGGLDAGDRRPAVHRPRGPAGEVAAPFRPVRFAQPAGL